MNPIIAALKKLERSNTQLTRKRARRGLRVAVNAILKQYPPIDKEGKEKRNGTRPTCPLCGIPARDHVALTRHLRLKHCGMLVTKNLTCPGCNKQFKTPRRVHSHIAGLSRAGKLREHVIDAATAHAFGETK